MTVECSLQWNAGYSEEVLAFTNNIHQKDGGTHLLGFRSSLTRIINKYASEKNLTKKIKLQSVEKILRKVLTAILSIKMPDPKFSSQTKDKLVSSEIRNIVENIVGEKIAVWFDQNPSIIKSVLDKVITSSFSKRSCKKS